MSQGSKLSPSAFGQLWVLHYGDRKTAESRKRAQVVFEELLPDSGFVDYLRSKSGKGEFALHLRTYLRQSETQEDEPAEQPQVTPQARESRPWSPPTREPASVQSSPAPEARRTVSADDALELRRLFDLWHSKGGSHVGSWSTFLALWERSDADLAAFGAKVRSRLFRYDSSSEPQKQNYLGHLSTFLSKGKWLDEPAMPTGLRKLPNPAADAIPDSEF